MEKKVSCIKNISKIRKRHGEVVPFDKSKITDAIRKANLETTDETFSETQLENLTKDVLQKIQTEEIPGVEFIQDAVEKTLIEHNFSSTAKAYILYRAEHTKLRESAIDLMDIYFDLTYKDAKNADLKRENANIDADTAMGTMLKYGSEGSKYFIDTRILPKDIAAAHLNGDIHIHDKDFYMLTETCCQIDLLKLFEGGFSTGHGYLREPNDIRSYAALGCIAIQANQNEMHGGQAVPHFDYAMAKGVEKTFTKQYFDHFAKYLAIMTGIDTDRLLPLLKAIRKQKATPPITMQTTKENQEQIIKYLAQMLKEKLSPPENALLDAKLLQKAHAFATKEALRATDEATYQAMEALIHNLNTMNSRAGAQVPFSSLNYGTDTSPEGRLVIKNLLKATMAGLGNGETPIFPVQIFKVKEGINYQEGDTNYDLFRLAIETSAKRLFPNFSFLDAPFNKQYYKEGDYNSEVAYMGCRTRVMGNIHDKNREITCGRGNLSFTSINLPRLAIEAKGNIDKFFHSLDDIIELVIRQLNHRFKIQAKKRGKNYPFLMGQGVWIDSEKIKPDDYVGEILKHGSLSMGFIGLAECLKALLGKHHGESEEAQKLGLQIVSHMRQRMDEESEKTQLNFALLATPAEGLSGRFSRIDREIYGKIAGVTDRAYYTNSFHIPVYYSLDAARKIQLEAPYHALCNAGHISYVEMDGDPSMNLSAFEKIIRYMHDQGIGYGSVNHPVDRDPVCGYNGIIKDTCPLCGRSEKEHRHHLIINRNCCN